MADLISYRYKSSEPEGKYVHTIYDNDPRIKNLMSGGDVEFNRPIPPSTPPSSVVYNPDGTRSKVDQYYEKNAPMSEQDIARKEIETREEFLKRQQAAIDSINNMYVGIINRAKEENQGRLGSANTINALSGQRGTPSGSANIQKTEQKNRAVLDSIDAEKQNKITLIMDKYAKDLTDELKYQQQLRREDTQNWLDYMAGKEEKDKARGLAMRSDLITQRVSPDLITDDQWSQMADASGYSVDEFKALYNAEYKNSQDEWVKNEQDRLRQIQLDNQNIEKGNIDIQNAKSAQAQQKAQFDNDLKLKGFEYVSDPKKLKNLKADEIVKLTDPNGQERIYKVPKGMSELELYEAKKQIDAKYKTSGGGSGGGTGTYPKGFDSAVKAGITNLQKGEKWGTVFDRIKNQFPDMDDNTIDKALGPEWRTEGAFEEWKAKQYKQGTQTEWQTQAPVWEWLASEEALNMTDEQKKQEIMANGFNPEDFGIY